MLTHDIEIFIALCDETNEEIDWIEKRSKQILGQHNNLFGKDAIGLYDKKLSFHRGFRPKY